MSESIGTFSAAAYKCWASSCESQPAMRSATCHAFEKLILGLNNCPIGGRPNANGRRFETQRKNIQRWPNDLATSATAGDCRHRTTTILLHETSFHRNILSVVH